MVLYKHKGMRKNVIASSYFLKSIKNNLVISPLLTLVKNIKYMQSSSWEMNSNINNPFAITPIDLNIFLFFLFTMSTKSQEDLIVYYFTISQLSTLFWQKRYINKYQNGHNHRKDIVEINEYMSHSEFEKWKLISFLALQNGPNNI